MMDERALFDDWFKTAYGEKPGGDLAAIEKEIDRLTILRDSIDNWENSHSAALAAWHEKHNRKETTDEG